MPAQANPPSSRRLLLRECRHAGARLLAARTALQVLHVALPTLTAFATGRLIGQLTRSAALSDVAPTLLVIGGSLLTLQLATLLELPVAVLAERRIDAHHRREIVGMIDALPTLDRLEERELQDELAQFRTGGLAWLNAGIGAGAMAQLSIVVAFLSLLLPTAVLVIADWRWGLIGLGLAVALRWLSNRDYLMFERVQTLHRAAERRTRAWAALLGGPRDAKEVRVFGLGDWLLTRYESSRQEHSIAQLAARRRMRRHMVWLFAGCVALTAAIEFGVTAAGLQGTLRPDRLTAVLATLGAMLGFGLSVGPTLAVETSSPMVNALHRLRTRTTEQPLSEAHLPPPPACSTTPVVRFEGVSFRYPGHTSDVLKSVDFTLRPGEVVALVGVNGAGKTTLTKLLCGLYLPTTGRIEADGTTLTMDVLRSWQQRIYPVFQDFTRFQLTALESIRIATADADDNEVHAAADSVGARALIERLPHGWNTVLSVGYRAGTELSGGQWQRIALARAALAARHGARILVLDEPTANLDIRAELDAFESIVAARNEAAVLLISHRFSTVRRADRILVLDDGRITETGTHKELLAAGGAYARMFRVQAARFTDLAADTADHHARERA